MATDSLIEEKSKRRAIHDSRYSAKLSSVERKIRQTNATIKLGWDQIEGKMCEPCEDPIL